VALPWLLWKELLVTFTTSQSVNLSPPELGAAQVKERLLTQSLRQAVVRAVTTSITNCCKRRLDTTVALRHTCIVCEVAAICNGYCYRRDEEAAPAPAIPPKHRVCDNHVL
jgi:radical SAM protein with 4Fe4S-binding SPASM domain